MSKFMDLYNKASNSLLKEQGEDPAAPQPDAAAGGAPGEPNNIADSPSAPVIDPNTESGMQTVSNDQIKDLVVAMKDFYHAGDALSADAKAEIESLPSGATDEEVAKIVETLTRVFRENKLPQDTTGTE